jgi:hypothetical protein
MSSRCNIDFFVLGSYWISQRDSRVNRRRDRIASSRDRDIESRTPAEISRAPGGLAPAESRGFGAAMWDDLSATVE